MKKRYINRITRYKSFVKGGILETFAYKGSIYAWGVAELLSIIILCCLWIAVFSQDNDSLYIYVNGVRTLNGFTMAQMITYLLTAKIIQQLVSSSQAFWMVCDDIREGNIAMQLIKPINYRSRIFANSVGNFIGQFMIAFVPIYLVCTIVLGLIFGFNNIYFNFKWYNFLFFLVSVCLSLMILDSFDFMVAQICYFTGASFGLMLFKDAISSFLSGALLPIAFFPLWAQKILNYLPFASMLQTPNFIMMGKYSILETIQVLGIQAFWAVSFMMLSRLCYAKSCKHVISVGG